MNITPKDGPTINQPAGSTASARDARERAIAKLMQPAASAPAQQMPVSNPSQVSPEELSAIKAPEAPKDSSLSGQNSNNSNSPDGQKTEGTVEAPKAEEPKQPLSSQFALMAKKEKALRVREAELKAREAAILAREAPPKPQQPEVDVSKYIPRDKLQSDPLSVLNELGVDYTKLTEMILSQPKTEFENLQVAEIKKLSKQVEQLINSREEDKKAYETKQQSDYQQALKQIRRDAEDLVRDNPQYETLVATKSVPAVVKLIERTFKEDGIILSVEDACQEIENYMTDEISRVAKLKKIQSRLQPTPAQQAEAPKTPETNKSQTQPMKTLTNAVSSGKPLSNRQRAIAAFEGKLNR